MTSTTVAAERPPDDHGLLRVIGPWGATMLLVGNVIGSAIFLTTGPMAAEVPSVSLILVAWVAGGLLVGAGGLTLAELGTMYPRSGGLYLFLEEAFGPFLGFCYGWALTMVMLPGSLAAVAVGFAEYFSYFFPALGMARVLVTLPTAFGAWSVSAGQIVAALSLVLVTMVNVFGVRTASSLTSLVTMLKLLALAAIPVVALALWPQTPSLAPVVPDTPRPLASFGVIMIAVMWAYDGWYYLAFAAGEVRDPSRTLPRAFIGGAALVTVTYFVVNAGYFVALPLDAVRGEVRIAERVSAALVGPWGASAVAAVVCLSTLGCNLAGALTGARIGFAMAHDGMFFRFAGALHPRYRTPHLSLYGLMVMSCALTLLGTYEQLFTYVTFWAVLFNTLAVAAIFRLRRTRPHVHRPYRTWGYPVVPLLFVAGSALLVVNTPAERPMETLGGLAIVLAGLPAFLYWRRRRGPAA